MKNTFCKFLSNGASISAENKNLVVKPCCWSTHKTDLSNIANPYWKSIDTWTPGCDVCHQQELSGIHSFRQSSFDIVHTDTENIAALDIMLDMTCNAACVICGPHYSTTWATQYNKFKIPITSVDYNFDQNLQEIFANIDLTNLQRIKFFGGEPLLTDTHIRVLEKITNAKNCDIWYTTNGSIIPDQRTLDLWSNFRLVFVEISIDGIDQQFEYIRWPLPWEKIERNIIKLKEIVPINVLFRINHTLNPLNVFYYDRLENWINKNFKTNRLGDLTEINVHPCWGEWGLDKTPADLRLEVYKKYPNHYVSNLLRNCKQYSHNDLIEFTKLWDPIRQNDWRCIFPEVVKFFK